MEVAELNKSKRHLLELLEQKDAETREKNATIQSYLDKIVSQFTLTLFLIYECRRYPCKTKFLMGFNDPTDHQHEAICLI